jgi:SAM-dependent methyltransferase
MLRHKNGTPMGRQPGIPHPETKKIRKEDQAHGLRFQGKRNEEGKEVGEGQLTREQARAIVDKFGQDNYRLDLGCGPTSMEGCIGIDSSLAFEPDIRLDLEKDPLPFDDCSVEEIYATHFLEHIHNLIPLMNECQRVLKPGGAMHIRVPMYPSIEAFQDPTHVRFFTARTFLYWHEPDGYWKTVGVNYGILPFRRMIQNPNANVELAVILRK